jgi:hypothetical protein
MRRGDMPALVHADGTKYVAMSLDQNTGRSNSIKTDHSSLERVEELKYLETILTLSLLMSYI